MVQKGLPGTTVEASKLGPGIRGAHIDDPNGFNPYFWSFDAE
jgi:hypothetical protein